MALVDCGVHRADKWGLVGDGAFTFDWLKGATVATEVGGDGGDGHKEVPFGRGRSCYNEAAPFCCQD